MSLQRCQQETTATEFTDWVVFLLAEEQREATERTKWDFYLARIAKEIRNSWAKSHVTEQSMLVDLQFTEPIPKKKSKKKISKKKYKKIVNEKRNAMLKRMGLPLPSELKTNVT